MDRYFAMQGHNNLNIQQPESCNGQTMAILINPQEPGSLPVLHPVIEA